MYEGGFIEEMMTNLFTSITHTYHWGYRKISRQINYDNYSLTGLRLTSLSNGLIKTCVFFGFSNNYYIRRLLNADMLTKPERAILQFPLRWFPYLGMKKVE